MFEKPSSFPTIVCLSAINLCFVCSYLNYLSSFLVINACAMALEYSTFVVLTGFVYTAFYSSFLIYQICLTSEFD